MGAQTGRDNTRRTATAPTAGAHTATASKDRAHTNNTTTHYYTEVSAGMAPTTETPQHMLTAYTHTVLCKAMNTKRENARTLSRTCDTTTTCKPVRRHR